MDATEMHERAQAEFATVLAKVSDDDLDKPTPCSDWTVADLIDHVIDGNQGTVVHMGGSETDLHIGDRVNAHAASADRANAVFSEPGWGERSVELAFGSIPAPVFASIRSGDLYAHAWDLATAIGADSDLDSELGEAVMAATAPVLSPALRGSGVPIRRGTAMCAGPADRGSVRNLPRTSDLNSVTSGPARCDDYIAGLTPVVIRRGCGRRPTGPGGRGRPLFWQP